MQMRGGRVSSTKSRNSEKNKNNNTPIFIYVCVCVLGQSYIYIYMYILAYYIILEHRLEAVPIQECDPLCPTSSQ